MTLSRRSVLIVLVVEAFVAAALGAVVLDLRAHRRTEERMGVNSWGLRGTATLVKRAGATRLVVLGGSAAYGYGLSWPNTFPHYFERALNQGWRRKYRGLYTEVINLAGMGDGAASYAATLADYAYLHPDAVCVYDGYADLGDPASARRQSVWFRRAGYVPVLFGASSPAGRAVVASALRDGGDPPDMSCEAGSARYCTAMAEAVEWALARQLPVLVVTPPHVSRRHAAQQQSLARTLASRFASNRRYSYVDIGAHVDLHDPTWSVDGVYLTARGNQWVAETLADPMFDALASR